MKFSVVIPAHNEPENISRTVESTAAELCRAGMEHEIIVVNDGSSDETEAVLAELSNGNRNVKGIRNPGPRGFGMAVRAGLEHSTGDALAIMMADGSDSPADLVRCFRKILEGCECVFGSRFIRDSKVVDYPVHKLILNRLANWFIKAPFRIPYNDVTNAFKCYRRSVIAGIGPLISKHCNLTVEMPLKAIVRGYSYAVIPISWTNRRAGISTRKIREMGSRYLFIILYVWLEKLLARGDYQRDKALPNV